MTFTRGDLRKKIIRLAYQKPELREDLLPLIQKQAKSKDITMLALRAKDILEDLRKALQDKENREGEYTLHYLDTKAHIKKATKAEKLIIELLNDIY